MSEHELLAVLGLRLGASAAQIKEAYHRLAKRYHPDVSNAEGNAERFDAVVNAYRQLCEKRRMKKFVQFPGTSFPEGSGTQPRQDIKSVGEMLLHGSSASLRAFAARNLGNSGKKNAYIYLRKALYDVDEFVVCSSVRAIGELDIKQSAGELSALFGRGNKNVRLAILEAMKTMGVPDGFRNILMAGMRDGDPDVRKLSLSLYSRRKGSGMWDMRHASGSGYARGDSYV